MGWRRTEMGLVVVSGLIGVPYAALPQQAPSAEIEALLGLHHTQRTAHVLADPELLVASIDEALTEVSAGTVSLRTRGELRERFGAYFQATRFLEWENVRPPRVRVSPGGDWAELVVEKRVRTLPADPADGPGGAWRYAWTERWEARDEGWRLTTITSTDRPEPEETTGPGSSGAERSRARARAYDILARARRNLGGDTAIANVGTLRFVASCEGPNGPFRTVVASARDGRVSFVQRFPTRPLFGAGRSLAGDWETGEGQVDSLGGVLESVVAAHELHLLVLAPEARFSDPRARPPRELDGRTVEVVVFRDALGADVEFLYDRETGRPAAFRPVNHTGQGPREITTTFGDWRSVSGVMVPFHMRIHHGEDLFEYRIESASVAWLPDAAFTLAAATGDG